ncbi:filamentous hemagglutinin N-terminal domain-containing protein [Erwinia sp. 9145]|uniref:filamentous hemagglutinin N-terminal domain-containing protein n=1 Tax=Erwinia sp. 9145 TaxID=1500895 RepID=UPI000550964D|nr:filamentous hemagglutinin N-terminal domain-containing protein [Erwinia sp. 9145]
MRDKNQKKSPIYSAFIATLIASGYSIQSYSAIIPDMNHPQSPKIISSNNGTTVVNINPVSGNGLSHNVYSNFDVGMKGVVLNNGTQASNTQLAGNIAANERLAGQSASIILNEVTSGLPSILAGMVEVAGEKAQVIVANPAGITCSGCGFINTQRSTLATGKALIDNGVLKSFDIKGGQVDIKGKGLIDHDSSYTDILTNMLKVSAALKAENLRIVTGKNAVDNDTLNVTKTGQNNSWFGNKVAVDVTALGGIQADRITMIATEEGFGVKNAGLLQSTLNDITITTAGYLSNNGVIDAASDLTTTLKGNLSNSGRIKSGRNMMLSTQGNNFENAGELVSTGHLTIQSGKLVNKTSIRSAGDLVINTGKGDLENGASGRSAELVSQRAINISAANLKNVTDSVIYARQEFTLETDHINNETGRLLSEGDMEIKANSLWNYRGGLYATNNMLLNIDKLDLSYSGITTGQDLTINATKIDNRMGGIETGGKTTLNATDSVINDTAAIATGELIVNTNKLSNTGGILVSKGDMKIDARSVVNRYKTLYGPMFGVWLENIEIDVEGGIVSGGALNLKTERLSNQQSRILSNNDMTINANSVDNANADILSKQSAILNIKEMRNQNGNVKAGQDLLMTTHAINGTSGLLQAGNDLQLKVDQAFSNYQNISAGNDITLDIDGGFHNWSTVKAGNNIDITASQLGNYLFNRIYADNKVNLNVDGIVFNIGSIDSGNKSGE